MCMYERYTTQNEIMMAAVVNLKPFFSSLLLLFSFPLFHTTSYLFVPFDSVKSIKKRNERKAEKVRFFKTSIGKTIKIEKKKRKKEGCLPAFFFPAKEKSVLH